MKWLNIILFKEPKNQIHNFVNTVGMLSRPENVGIVAMDIYFPKTVVSQTELGNPVIGCDMVKQC
jgi:hypothetical protein